MEITKSFLKTSISFGVRILGALSLLVLSLIITRELNPNEAGFFLQSLSLSIPIASIARLGADYSLLKIIKNSKYNNFKSYFEYYITKRAVLSSFLISTIVFLTIILLKKEFNTFSIHDYYYIFIIPFSIFSSIINIQSTILQAKEKIIQSIFNRNIWQYLGTVIIFLILSIFIKEVTLIYFFLAFFTASVFIPIATKIRENTKPKIHYISKIKNNISWKYTSSSFYFMIFLMLQQWFILISSTYLLDSENLAYINVIFRISNILSFALIAVNSIFSQRFANIITNKLGKVTLKNEYIKSIKSSIAIGLPLFIVLYIFSSNLLSEFGHLYSHLDFFLKILLFSQLINVISGPIIQIITLSDLGHLFLRILIPVLLFLFLISIFSITYFNIEGAVLSHCLIIITVNIIGFIFFYKKLI